MEPAPEVSVVIPFFNEEGNIIPLLEELVPELDGLGLPWEVVAVDDGSQDGTHEELCSAARRWPQLRHLRFAENRGQTAAFDAGFKAARGELIATMDGDRQIDPKDLPLMVEQLRRDGVDFVYGWRRDRRDPFLKRVSTKIANKVRNRLTGEDIADTGCPLKLFRSEVLAGMKLYTGMHRFFITLAHIDGYRSSQMVVRHRPRVVGSSKYGVWNRVFRALKDCLTVRWMQRRHFRYEVEELPADGASGENPSREESSRSEEGA